MADCLSVNHERFRGDFPKFRRPAKVGEFSLDDDRKYAAGCSQRKFISWPSKKPLQNGQSVAVNFDLNHNIEQVVRKDESHHDERLENLLQWISRNQDKFRTSDQSDAEECLQSLSTSIVCYRGLLTRLMATPYESREPWIICAARWRDTVYLCAFDTEQKVAERRRETERQRTMCSWGFKFEQYMMADGPGQQPDLSVPVAETSEFCCVLRGRLGAHSLLFGAEVDGVDAEHGGGDASCMAHYVELKTSRKVENQRQRNTLQRFKMLKWWAQSFLVGIERVVVGFRDDEGIVHRVHCYGTDQLPRDQQFWTPAISMNFTSAFLGFVSSLVTGDDPRAVWRFDFDPSQRKVTGRKLGGSERERYRILPEWYIKEMFTGRRAAGGGEDAR